MKLLSWNVNGIRACINKGFSNFFNKEDADIFCVQETKATKDQVTLETEGYYQYWNSAEKKGYSGTAVFTKDKPISVTYGIGHEKHDNEGRVITLEFNDFYLVTVYTPNSKRELARLDYRMEWEDDFRDYVNTLDKQKPVIICGDLNVAHKEIDLKNPKNNKRNAGFTDEERSMLQKLLDTGFTDSFRLFYPDIEDAYTWWSYMFKAREKNAGWRIDYFLVSSRIASKLQDAYIYKDVLGSDHCPIGIELK